MAKKVVEGNQYEGMFLLGASFATDVDGAIKLVRGIVERHEGKVLVIKKWDERKLAYELEGQKRGLYIICFFTAPSASVAPIERDVNLSEQILRVLITHADHLNTDEMTAVEPQPIQPREERPNPWDRPPMYEETGIPPRSSGPRDGGRDSRPPRSRPDESAAYAGKD
jgi:ribosomal protein S6